MKCDKINELIATYLKSDLEYTSSENFCNIYMNMFFDLFDELENELQPSLFEVLDDINIVCDSYEKDINIRNMEKFCIGEIELKEKIKLLFDKFNI